MKIKKQLKKSMSEIFPSGLLEKIKVTANISVPSHVRVNKVPSALKTAGGISIKKIIALILVICFASSAAVGGYYIYQYISNKNSGAAPPAIPSVPVDPDNPGPVDPEDPGETTEPDETPDPDEPDEKEPRQYFINFFYISNIGNLGGDLAEFFAAEVDYNMIYSAVNNDIIMRGWQYTDFILYKNYAERIVFSQSENLENLNIIGEFPIIYIYLNF